MERLAVALFCHRRARGIDGVDATATTSYAEQHYLRRVASGFRQGYPDAEIALTLNRLRLKTGAGNTWSEIRVRSLRSHLKLAAYQGDKPDGRLNMLQAAERLGVSHTVVRRLIAGKILPATQ
jgi:hypothetical protein